MNSIISRFGKVISFVVISISLVFGSSVTVLAAPKTMEDGTVFDAEFYAQTYPDVADGLGTDEKALYNPMAYIVGLSRNHTNIHTYSEILVDC